MRKQTAGHVVRLVPLVILPVVVSIACYTIGPIRESMDAGGVDIGTPFNILLRLESWPTSFLYLIAIITFYILVQRTNERMRICLNWSLTVMGAFSCVCVIYFLLKLATLILPPYSELRWIHYI